MLAKNLSEWRKVILERDNYICQICGEHGSVRFALIPFDGIGVCYNV